MRSSKKQSILHMSNSMYHTLNGTAGYCQSDRYDNLVTVYSEVITTTVCSSTESNLQQLNETNGAPHE